MKHLQLKYNLLFILYFICNCTVIGYAAIFLKWRGFSNTEVGIVVGISDLLMLFSAPKISGLVKRFRGLTLQKLISGIFLIAIFCWGLLIFVKMPDFGTMIIFIFMANIQLSVMPLLSTLCMNYIKAGDYLNFGSARGLASLGYAAVAFLIGILVDLWDPQVLILVEAAAGAGVVLICRLLPDVSLPETNEAKGNEISLLSFTKKYPQYMLLLLGIMFQFLSGSTLNTYMINIVRNLGGTASLYGVVTFFMSASELPFMAVAHRLMKKHKTSQLFLFSSAMYVVRNYLICLAPHIVVVVLGMMCQGASFGLFFATMTYYCNDAIEEKDQMMGQTVITVMTTGVGAAIGVLIGGRLQDLFGLYSMYYFVMGMTLLGFVIVVISMRMKTGVAGRSRNIRE